MEALLQSLPPIATWAILAVGAAAAAIVNTMAGGGSMLVVPLMLAVGLPPGVANGTLRVGILVQNISAVTTFHRRGERPYGLVARLALPIVLGAGAGTFVATRLDDAMLLPIIGVLLAAWAVVLLLRPARFLKADGEPRPPNAKTMLAAVGVGFYGGFLQVAVGFPLLALLTMVVGALGAVAQADIKRILSFTLVSHIGYMILGVALGTAEGTAAAVYYIAHHIVVQTTLFLAAGLIEREAGSTSISRVGGLLASAPLVALLFFIPAINLGGIPPFSGFIGKLALFQAAAEQGGALAYTLIGGGALVSLLTLYTLVRVWNLAFWRGADEVGASTSRLLRHVNEAPLSTSTISGSRTTPRLMTFATASMVAVGVALTVFAGPLYGIAERAGENLDGPQRYILSVFEDGTEPDISGVIEEVLDR